MKKITHLRQLKANLLGRFICIRGTVVRVSSVKPFVEAMSFQCSNCLQFQTTWFEDGKYGQPSKCTTLKCRGKVFLPYRGVQQETKAIDWQRIRIQGISAPIAYIIFQRNWLMIRLTVEEFLVP